MKINKNIEFSANLATDEADYNTVYVRFYGTIDATGAPTTGYSIDESNRSVFVAHQKDFREALTEFNNRIWDETDAYLAQLEAEQPTAPEATVEAGTEDAEVTAQ